jgi:hypothetical protein
MQRTFTTLRAALSAAAFAGLLAAAPTVALAQAGPGAAANLLGTTAGGGTDRGAIELVQGNRHGWRQRTLRRHYYGPRRGYRSGRHARPWRYRNYRAYRAPRYRYGYRYRASPRRYYGYGPALMIGGTLALSQSRYADRWQRCDDRYKSFRWSDGTFQPYGGGPRQLCPYLRR